MKSFLKSPLPFTVGLALVFAALVFFQDQLQWTQWLPYRMELKLLDAKFFSRGPIPMDPKVVIVAGDEAALKEFGPWGRWTRRVFEKIIVNVLAAGAESVGFDMVWSEEVGEGESQQIQRVIHRFRSLEIEQNSRAAAERMEAARERVADLEEQLAKAEGALARSGLSSKARRQVHLTLLSLRDAHQSALEEMTEAEKLTGAMAESTERYVAVLQDEAGGISPDEALANAIAENPTRVVVGFIAELKANDPVPTPEQRATGFSRVEPSAMDQFYRGLRAVDGSPTARLARTLQDLCAESPVPCKASPEDVTGRAGLSEEDLTAALQALSGRKLAEITEDGLTVPDPAALAKLSEVGPETRFVEWQPVGPVPRESTLRVGVPVIEGELVGPLEKFASVGQNFGFFSAEPEADGVFRKQPLFYRFWPHEPRWDRAACTACNRRMLTPAKFEELSDPSKCSPPCEQACTDCMVRAYYLPSLSLALLQQSAAATPIILKNDDYEFLMGIREVALLPMDPVARDQPLVKIPTDPMGRLLLNYYGPWRDPQTTKTIFPTVSAYDVFRDQFDKDLVKGKAVLFAVTAAGTFDQRSTPYDPFVPGVIIHATAAQNMFEGRFLNRPWWTALAELLFILLMGVLLGLALSKVSVFVAIILASAIGVTYWFVDVHFCFKNGLWVQTVWPYVQLLSTFIVVQAHGYLTVGREKAAMRKAFGACLDPMLVDELADNPDTLQRLKGDERDASCMFSDIRGFTTLSENLTPQELTVFLNDYFTPQAAAIMHHKGYLDKYIGDAIMALFGAPQHFPDHAVAGCNAALDMMDQLHTFKDWVVTDPKWAAFCQRLISKNMDPASFDIGIGLNSGVMRVGYMGSAQRTNYSALGDAVNLASRLEGQTKEYGVHVIISEATYAAAKHAIHARRLDAIRVKGKKEPVRIYELIGRGEPSPEWAHFINLFESGIQAFLERRFEEAIPLFAQALRDKPVTPKEEAALLKKGKPRDLISAEYIARCEDYLANPPPPDWDGVVTKTTK